jgi:hypothetical protein
MRNEHILIALCGLAIFSSGIFSGCTKSYESHVGKSENVNNSEISTLQSETLSESAADQPSGITPFSDENVWVYCADCGGLPHVLWETPNEIGVNRPLVNEMDQCLILDRQITTEGISKVELLCGASQGWLSAEGISFTEP